MHLFSITYVSSRVGEFVVNQIYQRLIQLETHSERRFPNWTMGFANIAPTDRALLQHYFPDGIDSPEQINGAAAAAFLRALGESAETFKLR